METAQTVWSADTGWLPGFQTGGVSCPDLVLLFGSRALLKQADFLGSIRARFPRAVVAGCSTAGEIHGTRVTDDSLTVTLVKFDHTRCRECVVSIDESAQSREAGARLANDLLDDDLCYVLVLSDGLAVNGTDLIRGMEEHLPDDVIVTGGLAADGEHFDETYVISGGIPERNAITAIGFYSKRLNVGYGSFGGWDPFGPERLITRSEGNVLYELDGRSALELYKQYLGEYAERLPSSALLFPLAIRDENGEELVRTILGIREEDDSMIFAGDIPQGMLARFMRCNMDRLIDGASTAASATRIRAPLTAGSLALLVSCVGRRIVLRQRADEEVEAVRQHLGDKVVFTGFYSYGEMTPVQHPGPCKLLNQTMTITTLSES